MSIPCIAVRHNYNTMYEITRDSSSYTLIRSAVMGYTVDVPSYIDFYTNSDLKAYCHSYVYGDTQTLINIASSIDNKIDDTNNSLNDIKSSIDETNKFLKDTNTTDDDFNFSHDNSTNDVSGNGLETVFQRFI